MNIIIKRTPSWRPLQPKLGKFKTLHSKGKFNPSMKVEDMFSKEELERIYKAAHFTKKILSNEEIEKTGQDYNIL